MATPSKQQAFVLWVIWFAMLQSVFVLQWVLGRDFPEEAVAAGPMAWWLWLLCFGPIVAATALRWLVLPRAAEQRQLVAMIMGLALSEAALLISLFLVGPDYPGNQLAVFMLAVCSVIQFAPSYATPGYRVSGEGG